MTLCSFLCSQVEWGVTRRYRNALPINTCPWNRVSQNSVIIKARPSWHAHPTHYTLHRHTVLLWRPEGVRHTDHTSSWLNLSHKAQLLCACGIFGPLKKRTALREWQSIIITHFIEHFVPARTDSVPKHFHLPSLSCGGESSERRSLHVSKVGLTNIYSLTKSHV